MYKKIFVSFLLSAILSAGVFSVAPAKAQAQTLWSMAQQQVGTRASSTSVISAVKELAKKWSIAIPEWGIAGKYDHRKLGKSFLDAIFGQRAVAFDVWATEMVLNPETWSMPNTDCVVLKAQPYYLGSPGGSFLTNDLGWTVDFPDLVTINTLFDELGQPWAEVCGIGADGTVVVTAKALSCPTGIIGSINRNVAASTLALDATGCPRGDQPVELTDSSTIILGSGIPADTTPPQISNDNVCTSGDGTEQNPCVLADATSPSILITGSIIENSQGTGILGMGAEVCNNGCYNPNVDLTIAPDGLSATFAFNVDLNPGTTTIRENVCDAAGNCSDYFKSVFLAEDTDSPIINNNQSSPDTVFDNIFHLSGTVTDGGQSFGLPSQMSINVHHDQYGDTGYVADLTPTGPSSATFALDVILYPGLNVITEQVCDNVGHCAEKIKNITYVEPTAPVEIVNKLEFFLTEAWEEAIPTSCLTEQAGDPVLKSTTCYYSLPLNAVFAIHIYGWSSATPGFLSVDLEDPHGVETSIYSNVPVDQNINFGLGFDNPAFLISEQGTYTVTETLVDENGNTTIFKKIINDNPPPQIVNDQYNPEIIEHDAWISGTVSDNESGSGLQDNMHVTLVNDQGTFEFDLASWNGGLNLQSPFYGNFGFSFGQFGFSLADGLNTITERICDNDGACSERVKEITVIPDTISPIIDNDQETEFTVTESFTYISGTVSDNEPGPGLQDNMHVTVAYELGGGYEFDLASWNGGLNLQSPFYGYFSFGVNLEPGVNTVTERICDNSNNCTDFTKYITFVAPDAVPPSIANNNCESGLGTYEDPCVLADTTNPTVTVTGTVTDSNPNTSPSSGLQPEMFVDVWFGENGEYGSYQLNPNPSLDLSQDGTSGTFSFETINPYDVVHLYPGVNKIHEVAYDNNGNGVEFWKKVTYIEQVPPAIINYGCEGQPGTQAEPCDLGTTLNSDIGIGGHIDDSQPGSGLEWNGNMLVTLTNSAGTFQTNVAYNSEWDFGANFSFSLGQLGFELAVGENFITERVCDRSGNCAEYFKKVTLVADENTPVIINDGCPEGSGTIDNPCVIQPQHDGQGYYGQVGGEVRDNEPSSGLNGTMTVTLTNSAAGSPFTLTNVSFQQYEYNYARFDFNTVISESPYLTNGDNIIKEEACDNSGNCGTFYKKIVIDGAPAVIFNDRCESGSGTEEDPCLLANTSEASVIISGSITDPTPSSGLQQSMSVNIDHFNPYPDYYLGSDYLQPELTFTSPDNSTATFSFVAPLILGDNIIREVIYDNSGNGVQFVKKITYIETDRPEIVNDPYEAETVATGIYLTGNVSDIEPGSGLQETMHITVSNDQGQYEFDLTPNEGTFYLQSPFHGVFQFGINLEVGLNTVTEHVCDNNNNCTDFTKLITRLPETTFPEISNNEYPRETTEPDVYLSGTVIDAQPSLGLPWGGPVHVTLSNTAGVFEFDVPLDMIDDFYGNFGFSLGQYGYNLAVGANTITEHACDNFGNCTDFVKTITYLVDENPPVITNDPYEAETTEPTIHLSGNVSDSGFSLGLQPEMTVSVQNSQTSYSFNTPLNLSNDGSSGTFGFDVDLVSGLNTVTEDICDNAGRCASFTKEITYSDDKAFLNISVQLVDGQTKPPTNKDQGFMARVYSASAICGATTLKDLGFKPANYKTIWDTCAYENEGVETSSLQVGKQPQDLRTELRGVGAKTLGDHYVIVESMAGRSGAKAYAGFQTPKLVQGETRNLGFELPPGQPTKFIPTAFFTINSTGEVLSSRVAQTVNGSFMQIIQPEHVDWTNGSQVYPFIFIADSGFDVDVCLSVPNGYKIAAPGTCAQTFVDNEVKVLEFTLQDVGSPKTFDVGAKFKVKHKGKTSNFDLKIPSFNKKANGR